jgi:hypothetical protein
MEQARDREAEKQQAMILGESHAATVEHPDRPSIQVSDVSACVLRSERLFRIVVSFFALGGNKILDDEPRY